MDRSTKAYFIMVLIATAFIVYVVYANFFHDSQTTVFLSYKTDLARTFHVHAWLKVMKIHIVFACLSMVAGAVNFSSAILKRHRKFHRLNGYLYLVSVLIVVITSGYMAPYATGGKINSMAFNLLNILWVFFTIIAVVKIWKKQVTGHRKWMTRSYAFVFTNLLIHVLTVLFHGGVGLTYADSYTIAVYGSIVSLLLAAELVIRTVVRSTSPII